MLLPILIRWLKQIRSHLLIHLMRMGSFFLRKHVICVGFGETISYSFDGFFLAALCFHKFYCVGKNIFTFSVLNLKSCETLIFRRFLYMSCCS